MMFIRQLTNPRFRTQFILDPFSSALGEFAIPKDFPQLERLKQLLRHYIFNVHRERKEKRKILENLGREFPLKRIGEKPESLPRKVLEEQSKILENNRLQTILNTDFEMVRWENVYDIHVPEKVKKVWRGINKKAKKERRRGRKKTKEKVGRRKKLDEPNPL